MQVILVSSLFLSLVLVYDMELGDMPYVVLLFGMCIIVFGHLIKCLQGRPIGFKLNFSIKEFSPLDRLFSSTLVWLWLPIITSWLIGILISVVNGVDLRLGFRNFFGLVVYMIYPAILIVSPPLRSLVIMIYLSGMVQMFYGFWSSFGLMTNLADFHIESSFSEMRSLYGTGFLGILPLFIVGAGYHLLPKQCYPNDYGKMVNFLSKSLFFTLLTLIAIVVPTMSKGYILTTAILFLVVVFSSINDSLKVGRIHKNIIMLLTVFAILLYILPSSFYQTIIFTYSAQEGSNAIRNEQFEYLVSELTFLGNGLGAPLRSGYSRDPSGYGFELTYVNIVHKLGVFSIFLFLSYVITLLVAWNRILRKVYVFESLLVIGLMGFLVVGAGNPLLLSPTAVILHCVAMYILVKPFLSPLSVKQVNPSKDRI